jgi:C4-dicarboxylate transporter DctQ subunit
MVDRIENFTLVWTILGLAIIGFVQVFARYLFNYSFTWYEELGRYLSVFVAFLGAGIGVKKGSHFAMDLIVMGLNRPFRQGVQFAVSAFSGVFLFLLTYYSIKIVIRMNGFGATSPSMHIPMYIAYMPIPFFSMIMGWRFFGKAIGFLRELSRKSGDDLKEASS